MIDFDQVIHFGYMNHRGEYAIRTVIPQRMYWGTTPEHPTEQWLVHCYCLDRKADRTFSLTGMDFNKCPSKT